ncbi:MAG: EAL domain-containing protein [Bauldia sp.]|nr:EAL domain-containing protein [Bauldia sp.]
MRPPAGKNFPLEVYGSLVDALHEIGFSLITASIATTVAVLITAWEAESWIIFSFAVAIGAATALRVSDMRAYWRARPGVRTAAAFQAWEKRYVWASAVYVGLMGAWCLACFVVTTDPFVRFFGFTSVVAYMIGVHGRNFASNSLVTTQIVVGGVPLALSLVWAGGWYLAILILLLVPFLISIKLISVRLRKQLLDAVMSALDITELAGRFTTALNNMPHGLIMLDAGRRLVVANERMIEFLGLPRDLELTGRTSNELWAMSTALSDVPDLEKMDRELERRLPEGAEQVVVGVRGDRWLAFTARPMDNGGSVVIVEDITERRNAEQHIQHLARYDSLTGLPNRNHFHDMLKQALAVRPEEEPLAVLFIDLDEFKQVNDTLGHPRGDLLLIAVADRLRAVVTAPDTVARYGGDEFVVLRHVGEEDIAGVEELTRRILESVSQPYDIDGHQVVIGASAGIALAPKDGADPDLMLKNADMALYYAKAAGKAVWRLFDPSMDDQAKARMALEHDLRQAVAEEQFELYYQPLINLRTMRIQTCEALLRWNHPVRGRVSPAEFIPVAEDIGVIVQIGDWVIRQACLECAKWPSDVRVAVNLSSVQFKRDQLLVVISEALEAAGLPPHRLEIEITESVLLKDTDDVRALLQQLVERGIRISLDDFGTGYSSLSYLHTFPLSKVKIDRSFVTALHSGDRSLTLLKGVARLSAALGLRITVEGIETAEQLEIISSESSVDEAQGFLFSMPLPARQIRQLIAAQSGDTDRHGDTDSTGRSSRTQAA